MAVFFGPTGKKQDLTAVFMMFDVLMLKFFSENRLQIIQTNFSTLRLFCPSFALIFYVTLSKITWTQCFPQAVIIKQVLKS